MLDLSCRRIVAFFFQKGYIQSGECEWCVYALVSRVSMFISISFMIFLGMLFAQPLHIICFLLGILPLRRRLGGYHAKTPFACVCLSVVVMLLSIFCVNLAVYFHFEWVLHILLVLSSIAVLLSKPYGHRSMHLTRKELVRNKAKVKTILMVELLIIISLCFFFSQNAGALFCEIGIIAAAISFLLNPKT